MLREVGFEKKERDGIAQSDTLVEQLKQHFSEGEVVEIAGRKISALSLS